MGCAVDRGRFFRLVEITRQAIGKRSEFSNQLSVISEGSGSSCSSGLNGLSRPKPETVNQRPKTESGVRCLKYGNNNSVSCNVEDGT